MIMTVRLWSYDLTALYKSIIIIVIVIIIIIIIVIVIIIVNVNGNKVEIRVVSDLHATPTEVHGIRELKPVRWQF